MRLNISGQSCTVDFFNKIMIFFKKKKKKTFFLTIDIILMLKEPKVRLTMGSICLTLMKTFEELSLQDIFTKILNF